MHRRCHAGGQPEAVLRSAGGVGDRECDRRDRDGERVGALSAGAEGNMLLVAGAVQVLAVPAVGEAEGEVQGSTVADRPVSVGAAVLSSCGPPAQ